MIDGKILGVAHGIIHYYNSLIKIDVFLWIVKMIRKQEYKKTKKMRLISHLYLEWEELWIMCRKNNDYGDQNKK